MKLRKLFRILAGKAPYEPTPINPSLYVTPGQVIQFNDEKDNFYRVVQLTGSNAQGHNTITIVPSTKSGSSLAGADRQVMDPNEHQENFVIIDNLEPASTKPRTHLSLLSKLVGRGTSPR